MITVKDGGALAGYSDSDHLIDDSDIKDIIGLEYRSVGDALRAAKSRCWMRGTYCHPGYQYSYVWIEVVFADGTTKVFKHVK